MKTRNGHLLNANFVLDTLNLSLLNLYHKPRGVYKFGQGVAFVSGETLATSVVLHRLTKAYEVPRSNNTTERKTRSIRDVLERDANGFDFQPFSDPEVTRVFLRARSFIRTICDHFQPSYCLVFPTGEASTTSKGWKDLVYRLEDNKYWECSPGSFKYVSEIFYRNVHMKRLVKKRYYDLMVSDFNWDRRRVAYDNHKRFGANGRRIFRHMLSYMVTLRDTSRMTVVPKDNTKDRVITCEPFLTMICQLSFMADMRRALQKATGIDLTCLQEWHRSKLRMGHCTIDLSSASDLLWNCVVKALFPPRFNRHLQNLRTGVTEAEGTYHHFNMFSPMGCGLTFDVMTWTLTALARAYDERATVFGDDIMVKDRIAGLRLCTILPAFGFKVNNDKTFLVGNLRESCGGYADLTSDSFITCFDLRRPTNLLECFSVANKLRVIIDAGQVTQELRHILVRAWTALIHFLPRDAVIGGSAYVTDRFILDPTGNRQGRVMYNKDWQRQVTKIDEYYLYRDVQDGPVGHAWDAVRMLHLRTPVLHGNAGASVRKRKLVT